MVKKIHGQALETLLTAQTVAEKLSLSKRAVFRMRSAGQICSPIRVGTGSIRWRESDIEDWIAMGCPDQQTFEMQKGCEK